MQQSGWACILQDQSTGLDDVVYATHDGRWIVPPFKTLTFKYDLANYSNYWLTVLRVKGNSSQFEVVSNDLMSGYGGGFQTGSYSEEVSYKILITSQSHLHIYMGMVHTFNSNYIMRTVWNQTVLFIVKPSSHWTSTDYVQN